MSQCIIVYYDGDQLTLPYAWDDECEGALVYWGSGREIAVFPDAKAARKAIAISAAFARLSQAQGKPANTDFIDPKYRKNFKIVKLAARGHQ